MNELTTAIKAKDIRDKRHRPRQACYVCDKHKNITEWHHIIPLKDCAEKLNNGINKIKNGLFCLCPNCHSYFHKLLYSEISKDEEYIMLSTWGETIDMREKIIGLRHILNNYILDGDYEFN